MMGPDQYLFITPVWGDAYVDRFVKVCLPAQLSAGNLGAIPAGKGLFVIYTRREHARTILRSHAYRRLKTMMATAVRSLDDLPDPRLAKSPHELQTAAYLRGIRAGAGRETAFVFLTPDILVGDGTYRNMVHLAEEGKRVHLVAGIRMLSEGAVSCVTQYRGIGPADVTIPCRDLVRFCLDNPHPITVGHVVNDGKVHAAQHLYWRVGSHGLLARGFHLHPLLVWPRDPNATIRNTLDDEYVSRACPDRNDWHTVTDSDEMCVIEFSDSRHKLGMLNSEPLPDHAVQTFLRNCTTADHREHVLNRICFHTVGTNDSEWTSRGEESDSLVSRYLGLFEEKEPEERLGRVDLLVSASPAPKARVRRVARPIVAFCRRLYRLLNFKLYDYVERLNAMILHQQKQLSQAHDQLSNVSLLVETMMERIEEAEKELKRAAIRASDHDFRTRRRKSARAVQ